MFNFSVLILFMIDYYLQLYNVQIPNYLVPIRLNNLGKGSRTLSCTYRLLLIVLGLTILGYPFSLKINYILKYCNEKARERFSTISFSKCVLHYTHYTWCCGIRYSVDMVFIYIYIYTVCKVSTWKMEFPVGRGKRNSNLILIYHFYLLSQ